MTASERRQLRRSLLLGLLITALTVVADRFNWLDKPEGWLSTTRALHFQRNAPRPTDRLVHLDIDDAALDETIGKWPWPRDVQAKIVDELRLAGAAALGLDIMFPHPTRVLGGLRDPAQPAGPATQPLNDAADDDADDVFAAALRRFKHVTLAVSFTFTDVAAPSARERLLTDALEHDLEVSKEDADAKLRSAGVGPASSDEYFAALHAATARRLAAENPASAASYAALRAKLLPVFSQFRHSLPERVLETEFWRYIALRAMQRVMPPRPPGAPPLRVAAGEKPPVPQLTDAVAGIGCADNMPGPDGVVRWLPLWVQDGDRIAPQLGLSLACVYLRCDPRDVQINADSVVIPRKNGPPIVIPTTTRTVTGGKRVGTLIDIPMIGTADWETMYDYPTHRAKARHIPIGAVWDVVETRQRLRSNNKMADEAMITFLSVFAPEKSDELKARPPDPDNSAVRLELIRVQLGDDLVKQTVAQYKSLSPKERAADPNRALMEPILSLYEQLPSLVHQTELLEQQLAQRQAVLAGKVGGKAVLVGWTATGNVDFVPTTLHPHSPGVVVHGAIFNAIMTDWLLVRSPRWVDFLVAALMGIAITLITSITSPWKALFATVLLLGGFFLLSCAVLYDHNHRVIGLAGPVVAGLGVWSLLTAARFIAEAAEHTRIRKRFRAYKDPSLVNYIIEHPELSRLEAQVRVMTVAFTDLAGFTAMSEELREKAVRLLGRYMTRMVPIIRRHHGLINAFMGDGIMFSYGVPVENPSHRSDAALTILEMQSAMAGFNAEMRAEGNPEFHVRAGINTGEVIVGDAGPEDASDYTCLGDATNFAARLESANKATGTTNLVAASTAEGLHGRFLLRPIARLRVAGKKQGVMTYELLAELAAATEPQKRLASLTADMVDRYQAGKFTECLAAAGRLDEAFGASKLSALYRDRCNECLANPPCDFSGMIVLEKK